MKKRIFFYSLTFVFIISITTFNSFAQSPDWEQVGIFDNSPVNSITYNSEGVLFAGTYSGVYRSVDMGLTWAKVNTGLADTNVNVLSINAEDELFAGTFGGIYFSNTNGDSWEKRNNGLTFKKVRTLIIDAKDHVYIGASDSTEGIPSSIFLSDDKGNSWIEIDGGLLGGDTVRDFVTLPDDTVYAVTDGGGIIQSEFFYKWDITQEQWIEIFRYPPHFELFRLNGTPGGLLYAGESHGMMRSVNKGKSWESADLYPKTVLSIAPISDSELFAGTHYYGVYHTSDSGNTWQHYGLAEKNVIELKITESGHLLAGTEAQGLYRLNQVVTSSDEDDFDETLPTVFSLEQNYPNPFNPSTVISYQLSVNSFVRLEVFDITGQKVAVLVDGKTQPVGTHQVTFDASNLTSGMYIYRLKANGFIQTRKMMLIK